MICCREKITVEGVELSVRRGENSFGCCIGGEWLLGYEIYKDFYFVHLERIGEKKIYVGKLLRIIKFFLGVFLKQLPVVSAVEVDKVEANKLNCLLFRKGVGGLCMKDKKLYNIYSNDSEWLEKFKNNCREVVNE